MAFVDEIAPIVRELAPRYDIKCPSAVIAQAILESGWGKSSLASKYHNYFGLKCGTKWTGKSVNLATQEEYEPGVLTSITDNFRVYDSMYEGVLGYFEFIQLVRYQNLRGIEDPLTYLQTIIADGYATSSQYVDSCMSIIAKNNLTIYDKEGEADMALYLAQASIDENGKICGGKAGNQSGRELNSREFYSSSSNPWLFMVRAKDPRVRSMICTLAKGGVGNPYIGYDQWERNTLLAAAKAAGWQLANITTPCETDCSAFDATCIICAVYLVLGEEAGNEVYGALYAGSNLPATGNMEEKAASCPEYLEIVPFTGSECLVYGDSLVRDGHAVVVVDSYVASAVLADNATHVSSSSYPCKGWKGEAVKQVQRALVDKGYSVGSAGIDGDFGKDTDAAVRKFQRDNNLEDDGIVGPLTQGKLYGKVETANMKSYPTGTYQTCVDGLNVRTGAGTSFSRKAKSQLTADGQKHSNDEGQLNSGTRVTVSKISYDGEGNPWALIPSGWICINYRGDVYARIA